MALAAALNLPLEHDLICPTCRQGMLAVARPRVDLDGNYLLTKRGSYKLSRQEAELVHILVTRAPSIVRHDTIINGLWGLYSPSSLVDPLGEIHVIITHARMKITGSGWSIRNEYGEGYRLVPSTWES